MLSVAKRRRFKLLKQKSNPRVEFVLQKKSPYYNYKKLIESPSIVEICLWGL